MEIPKVRIGSGRVVTDSIQQLGRTMVQMVDESINNTITMGTRLSEVVDTVNKITPTASRTRGETLSVPCCPPEEECPPQCLLEITRHAYAGERIIVPFRIRNGTNQVKNYHIGIRPLVDENQNPTPSQPTLDKTTATIQPAQSVLVEMRIDLGNGFSNGHQYEATIVVRERDFNQNICFRLVLDPLHAPEVTPYDEKDLKSHFLSWQYHFYCEEKPARISVQGKPYDETALTADTLKQQAKVQDDQ